MSVKTIALLLLSTVTMLGASWDALQKLHPGDTIELTTGAEKRRMVTYRSATADALIITTNSGEQSLAKADVERVRIKQPGRRVKRGILTTAIGAAAGAGIGFAICPGCANEGNGYKFAGPGLAAGAGVGALGFLTSDYRTVYERR